MLPYLIVSYFHQPNVACFSIFAQQNQKAEGLAPGCVDLFSQSGLFLLL